MIRGGSSNVREFWIADHCLSITFRGIRGKGILKENLGEDWCASPHLQSAIHNLNSTIPRGHSSVGRAPALQAGSQGFESPCLQSILAREQVSRSVTSGFRSFGKTEAGWRSCCSPSGNRALLRTSKPAFVRFESSPVLLPYCPPTGTAKYAVNTPVIGSMALPVISPLLFMSFALVRTAE